MPSHHGLESFLPERKRTETRKDEADDTNR